MLDLSLMLNHSLQGTTFLSGSLYKGFYTVSYN